MVGDAGPDGGVEAVALEHARDDVAHDRRQQHREQRVAARPGHGDVEAHVGRGVGGRIGVAVAHRLQQLAELGDALGGGPAGRELGRRRLDRGARLVQVIGGQIGRGGGRRHAELAGERGHEVGLARVPDEGAAAVDGGDEALGPQLGQRLAQQRPADPELGRHHRLGRQLLIGRQLAADDLPADLGHQAREQGALLDRLHRDGGPRPRRPGRHAAGDGLAQRLGCLRLRRAHAPSLAAGLATADSGPRVNFTAVRWSGHLT